MMRWGDLLKLSCAAWLCWSAGFLTYFFDTWSKRVIESSASSGGRCLGICHIGDLVLGPAIVNDAIN